MDAVTLYTIATLANGEMKTRALPMGSAIEKCEHLAANLPKNEYLAWCRKPRPIIIAH